MKCKSIYGIGRRGVIFSRNSGYQIKMFHWPIDLLICRTWPMSCVYRHLDIKPKTGNGRLERNHRQPEGDKRNTSSKRSSLNQAAGDTPTAIAGGGFPLENKFHQTLNYISCMELCLVTFILRSICTVNVGRTTVNHLLCQYYPSAKKSINK